MEEEQDINFQSKQFYCSVVEFEKRTDVKAVVEKL